MGLTQPLEKVCVCTLGVLWQGFSCMANLSRGPPMQDVIFPAVVIFIGIRNVSQVLDEAVVLTCYI
jgi:hypothetical protein